MSGRDAARTTALGAVALACVWLVAAGAAAETGWIKDEVRLNLRSGPSTDYRIIGTLKTGDGVAILERATGWTRVRASELGEGWIPEGFLQADAPAAIRLESLRTEVEALRENVGTLSAETEELRSSNAELSSRDAQRSTEMERLTRENMAFKAGSRWPHWFAGAAILGAGMLVGAVLRAVGGRRRPQRVRL